MAVAPSRKPSDEITDFLASAPTLEAIIAYQLPEYLQERAHYLLDKNRGEDLSPDERREMDEFLQIDHLMTLVKAKARLKIDAA